ncbi:hypothetical protein DCAR_0728593 [Daucus carota subsp. sativus]|uniref:Glabrous enhancer-binding protein-like DBD domain-containing protein n=1 Tax=Daucus carota subsp. sativus TaxID=79200 RepID=A0A161ZKW8_DAUCS|nr:PREDICTED: mediator-associated protein 1-like [Daucus carota subsp. sativus]WOH09138.1 hypothetical protein DCAR_0728593 [Daucus carota subsp. sativus]
MVPKRQPHDLPPPIHSSESESEDSSSSDDSDSEPQQLTQPRPQEPHQDSQESSGSDADSGSDAESDSSSDKAQMPPSVVSPQPKKPTSTPAQLKANGKRPAEVEQGDKVSKSKKSKNVEKVDKGSKSVGKVDKGPEKSKLSNGEGSEDKKTALFARLFSEKDEIVLLEGMIDYREKKGADPSLDIVAFHESIEDMLSCSATKNQIVDKIRRLRKKFVNNLKRGQNGGDPVISRPHEYKSFELSKKIWGSEVQGSEVDGDSKGRNGRKRNKKDDSKKVDNGGSKTPLRVVRKESDIDEEVMHRNEVETEDCWSLYPFLCASIESEAIKNFKGPMSPKEYVKKVVSRLEKEKATELEHEWNDYIMMEQQVYVKRVTTISKQAEVAMKVMKP